MSTDVLTPYGVCYDLEKSPYVVEYRDWAFHFSTKRNAKNFQEKAHVKELWLTDSFTRRFHYSVDAHVLALFQLYEQLEKRGMYIMDKREGCVYDNANKPCFAIYIGV